MYQVIIIDDEIFFRQALVTTFPWQDFGIQVCGEASNGNDALLLLAQYKPDIAFVDINMPGINGLQFIRQGKSISPRTKYIIISGFSEFSYAQEAIGLGVVKYLLKPLRFDDLKITLDTLLHSIYTEDMKNEHIDSLSRQNSKYLISLRRQFLSQLISYGEKKLTQSASETCEYLNLPWNHRGFFQVVLIATPRQCESKAQKDVGFNRIQILSALQSYDLPFDGQACETHDGLIAMVFAFDAIISVHQMRTELEKIQIMLSEEIQSPLCFGVSLPVSSLSDIPSASTLAYKALLKNRLRNDSMIQFYDAEENARVISLQEEFRAAPLLAAIASAQQEEIDSYIKGVQERIYADKVSEQLLASIYLNYLRSFLSLAEGLNDNNITKEIMAEIRTLSAKLQAEKLVQQLHGWCLRLLSATQQQPAVKRNPFVDEVIHCIQEQYDDPSLTIEVLSKQLHLNYAYLCSVFKHSTDMTINKYIKQYRLEKAKELLDSTNLGIAEIAAKVGFQNTNYFSKCFKKNYGISPSDYESTISKRSQP